uniref:Uncharacterized protein n=1 Tax=Anguilla anguilla TaxID=7936 RepID=A0A0E9QVU6_ANGAN
MEDSSSDSAMLAVAAVLLIRARLRESAWRWSAPGTRSVRTVVQGPQFTSVS